jgi:hypothetical protein
MATRDRTREYVARLDQARATLAAEVEGDVAPVRHLSLEERGEWVARACASAWAILRSRPDAAAVLAWRDRPAPDFEDKWRALTVRFRGRRQRSRR